MLTSWRETRFPTNVEAKDLLKFMQDLGVQLVGTTPARIKAAKRQRQNVPPEDHL